ncbi:MAG: sulfatase-like hydrolase/transferase [Candidatus Omnitrophica bacterium]|nr:sulfatase-like hydrolase/transferase [Candidatus Omnitrophota bacterium]
MNFIFIVADCARADYVNEPSRYGLCADTLDALRARGTTFLNAVTVAPWTNPAISSMLTGRYPFKLNTYQHRGTIPSSCVTLQSFFEQRQYAVASFFNTRGLFGDSPVAEAGTTRDIPVILDWIKGHAGRPFFLFLHYWQTHPPYFYRYSKESWYRGKDRVVELLRSGGQGREVVRRRYADAVERFSEEFLEAVLDQIDRLHLRDETNIVLTGDHGESFGDRTGQVRDLFAMHGESLYDEVLRVPLIAAGPAFPRGEKIPFQVRNMDIYETLRDVAGGGSRPEEVDSRSLRPLWEQRERGARTAIVSTTYAYFPREETLEAFSKYAVRDGEWKYLLDLRQEREELYHLSQDPEEQKNVLEKYPEQRSRLEKVLRDHVEIGGHTPEEKEALRQQLEDLGYL